MHNNLDNEKEYLKKEGNKRKEKCDNLHDNEKEQLRKYEKKGKKVTHDSLGDDEKEHRKNDKKRKIDKCLQTLFLILSECVVGLIPAYSQHQLSD